MSTSITLINPGSTVELISDGTDYYKVSPAQPPAITFIFDFTAVGLVLNSTTNLDIVRDPLILTSWEAVVEVAADAILKFDILLVDGLVFPVTFTSILDSNKIQIPAGVQQVIQSGSNFTGNPMVINANSLLQGKVIQIGSAALGTRATVNLYGSVF